MTTSSQPITTTDLVLLDVDAGPDKEAVIGRLTGSLAAAGRTQDPNGLQTAAMAREAQSATGLPGGIAIPHCRSPTSTFRPSVSRASTRRSTSVRPTVRPTWSS